MLGWVRATATSAGEMRPVADVPGALVVDIAIVARFHNVVSARNYFARNGKLVQITLETPDFLGLTQNFFSFTEKNTGIA